MKVYLVSFATPEFYESQEMLNISALKHGVDETIPYNDKILRKTPFYKENKSILKFKKGGGYWLWKPYIVLENIKKINYGDVLIYADSDAEIVRDLTFLINLCKEKGGILLFKVHHHINSTFTKRDCFILMNCDSEDMWNTEQVMGGFQIYVKNDKSINFLQEWLHYCKHPKILTDTQNICGLDNFPNFIEHRHDQSILSLLAIKHKIEIFRDPSQWGNHLKMKAFRENEEFLFRFYSSFPLVNSQYPTVLNFRNKRVYKGFLGKLYTISKEMKRKSKLCEKTINFLIKAYKKSRYTYTI